MLLPNPLLEKNFGRRLYIGFSTPLSIRLGKRTVLAVGITGKLDALDNHLNLVIDMDGYVESAGDHVKLLDSSIELMLSNHAAASFQHIGNE